VLQRFLLWPTSSVMGGIMARSRLQCKRLAL
jgi:hypothetical protein